MKTCKKKVMRLSNIKNIKLPLSKLIFSAMAVLCLSINVYAHTANVANEGTNKYKSLRLTPEVYNNSNPGLSDLRLKNSQGEAVPFFINGSLTSTEVTGHRRGLRQVNSFVKGNDHYLDFALTEDTPKDDDLIITDTLASSIVFETDAENFAKVTELYGSYDGLNWKWIQDDTLYNVSGDYKFAIDFGMPLKFTYYRLKLSNNLEEVSFSKAYLLFSDYQYRKIFFEDKLYPAFTVENNSEQTVLLSGMKNLRLTEIVIETDSFFKRQVSVADKSFKLYNLTFGGVTYTNTAMPMENYLCRNDSLLITIKNFDDKPIQVKQVKVKYLADELVFDGGSSDGFVLEFGEDPQAKPPIYDIQSYKEQVLAEPMDRLSISSVALTTQSQVDKGGAVDLRLVFNIVVVVVAVGLGVILIGKVSRT